VATSPLHELRAPQPPVRDEPHGNAFVRKITVRHTIGTALQFCCLVFLPLMVIFSMNFYNFPLVVMPISLLITIAIFSVGQGLKSK
jgi:hypothetical protein